jgi:hypothetical protein
MKTNKTTLAVALAVTSLWAVNASAQTYYANGDLLLGIQSGAAGVSNNVVMDLGSFSTYANATAPVTVDTTQLASQLTAAGIPLNNLYFSVFGDIQSLPNDPLNKTIFASVATGSPGWNFGLAAAQGVGASRVEGIGAGYNDNLLSGNVALVASGFNFAGDSSYTKGVTGASAIANLNYFNGSIENNTANGLPSSVDLYELVPSGVGAGSSALLGSFTLGSDGSLTFTPVPEPSTMALVGLGALCLTVLRRKQSKI